jgi:hypothetical protein
MARQAIILCQVRDIDNVLFDVREMRDTVHGWPVYLGWPADGRRGPGGGGPRVILTRELADYIRGTRVTTLKNDLPFGGTVLKKLRVQLEINYYADVAAWWEENPDGQGKSHSAKSMWKKSRGIKTSVWTPEEDAALLASQHLRLAEIAQKMGRSKQGVRLRLHRLKNARR